MFVMDEFFQNKKQSLPTVQMCDVEKEYLCIRGVGLEISTNYAVSLHTSNMTLKKSTLDRQLFWVTHEL